MRIRYFFILMFLFKTFSALGQEGFSSSGGDIVNSSGSESFSAGLVVFTELTGEGGSAVQGIQHALEVYIVFVKENTNRYGFSIFPNPAAKSIILQASGNITGTLEYQLYDIQGKNLLSDYIRSKQTMLNTTTMPSGIYFLRITQNGQLVQSLRVIKTQ